MQEEQKKRKELRKSLKKKVMDRVLSPEFNDNIHDVVAQNAMLFRMKSLREIPENHKKEVSEIKQNQLLIEMLRGRLSRMGLPIDLIQEEPRAIKQLNLIERMKSEAKYEFIRKWTAGPSFSPTVMAYLNIHPGNPSLN